MIKDQHQQHKGTGKQTKKEDPIAKIRLFKNDIFNELFYAAESLNVTKGKCLVLQMFQNEHLMRIMRV